MRSIYGVGGPSLCVLSLMAGVEHNGTARGSATELSPYLDRSVLVAHRDLSTNTKTETFEMRDYIFFLSGAGG